MPFRRWINNAVITAENDDTFILNLFTFILAWSPIKSDVL